MSHYPYKTIIFPMNESLHYLEFLSLRSNQIHIIHFQLCLTQNN